MWNVYTTTPLLSSIICESRVQCLRVGHTCNVTAYRNTVLWQCGRDSWPRNTSKVGYAVKLRACSVCYSAVASKGLYGYALSGCGRATRRCTSTPAQTVTVSSLWCDGQIPTAHQKSLYRYRVTNFGCVTWSRVPSTLSRYGFTIRGNVTSVYPLLRWGWH
jgi:hypothetical protein